jgi:hypothetical protein
LPLIPKYRTYYGICEAQIPTFAHSLAMGKKPPGRGYEDEEMYAILRAEKLNSVGAVAAASQHATRERETPNADPNRTPENRVIFGAADPAAEIERRISALEKSGVKIRKNGVRAIELVQTASPEFFQQHPERMEEFFRRVVAWNQKYFGEKNVVSCIAHMDETTPHVSTFILPLDTSARAKGSPVRLNAARWLDGRQKLSQMQTDFAMDMASLGLERGVEKSRAKHTSIREYYGLVREIQETDKTQAPVRAKVFSEIARLEESIDQAGQILEERKKRAAAARRALHDEIQAHRLKPGQSIVGVIGDTIILDGKKMTTVSDGNTEWYIPYNQINEQHKGKTMNISAKDSMVDMTICRPSHVFNKGIKR